MTCVLVSCIRDIGVSSYSVDSAYVMSVVCCVFHRVNNDLDHRTIHSTTGKFDFLCLPLIMGVNALMTLRGFSAFVLPFPHLPSWLCSSYCRAQPMPLMLLFLFTLVTCFIHQTSIYLVRSVFVTVTFKLTLAVIVFWCVKKLKPFSLNTVYQFQLGLLVDLTSSTVSPWCCPVELVCEWVGLTSRVHHLAVISHSNRSISWDTGVVCGKTVLAVGEPLYL